MLGTLFARALTIFVLLLVGTMVASRRQRRSTNVPPWLEVSDLDRPRRRGRGVADYVRAIRRQAGFEWRLLSVAAVTASTFLHSTKTGAITLGLCFIALFPVGYLWWRRWGPGH